MNRKVLFVDDDELMLDSYKRRFAKKFDLSLANDGKQGLEVLQKKYPFAVIISDFRMPKMDGVAFLAQAQKMTQDTTRIMLTGQAGFQDTVNAVNEGNIFRFLTKPCQPELLENAVEAGIEQFRLINAERELLENTLTGCIKMFSEVLSLSQPDAFSRASRLRHYINLMASHLELENKWQYKLAAVLSQIGFISLPTDLLKKLNEHVDLTATEEKMVAGIPEIAYSLIKKIPRLEAIAEMVRIQKLTFNESQEYTRKKDGHTIALGAQLLKIAIDYDAEIMKGAARQEARTILNSKKADYNPEFLDALQYIGVGNESLVTKSITADELQIDMVLDENIIANNGHILVSRGQVVTEAVLRRVENFSSGMALAEPLRVKCHSKSL
ncbi:MAG: response regulator [Calditrichaeota bacterium]|nr:MAG: response regulator [Calditrichota bacterium]